MKEPRDKIIEILKEAQAEAYCPAGIEHYTDRILTAVAPPVNSNTGDSAEQDEQMGETRYCITCKHLFDDDYPCNKCGDDFCMWELSPPPEVSEEEMKVVYIAHPISGDIKGNLKRIELIGRQINIEEPNIIPFAHYFFDCYSLNDNIPEERERGIKNDVALMKKGFIDEIRLYGDRISTGMKHEIELARKLSIPIRPMTSKLRTDLHQKK